MTRFYRFLFHFHPSPIWADALRVGVCTTLLVDMLLLKADFPTLYGADRFVDMPLLALKQDFPAIQLGPLSQHLVWVAYVGSCLAAICRYRPRAALVLLLILHQLIFTGHTLFAYGFDYLAASALWYALFAPTTRKSPWHSPILRTLQLHLCAVYAVGGINKAFGAGWWDGHALWKAVVQPGYPAGIPIYLLELVPEPCWAVGGWLTIALELAYPIFIWRLPTRRFFLWGIIALHAGIALLMGLYLFSALMMVLNLVAFYYPYLPFSKQLLPRIPFNLNTLRTHAPRSETPAETSAADTKRTENAC